MRTKYKNLFFPVFLLIFLINLSNAEIISKLFDKIHEYDQFTLSERNTKAFQYLQKNCENMTAVAKSSDVSNFCQINHQPVCAIITKPNYLKYNLETIDKTETRGLKYDYSKFSKKFETSKKFAESSLKPNLNTLLNEVVEFSNNHEECKSKSEIEDFVHSSLQKKNDQISKNSEKLKSLETSYVDNFETNQNYISNKSNEILSNLFATNKSTTSNIEKFDFDMLFSGICSDSEISFLRDQKNRSNDEFFKIGRYYFRLGTENPDYLDQEKMNPINYSKKERRMLRSQRSRYYYYSTFYVMNNYHRNRNFKKKFSETIQNNIFYGDYQGCSIYSDFAEKLNFFDLGFGDFGNGWSSFSNLSNQKKFQTELVKLISKLENIMKEKAERLSPEVNFDRKTVTYLLGGASWDESWKNPEDFPTMKFTAYQSKPILSSNGILKGRSKPENIFGSIENSFPQIDPKTNELETEKKLQKANNLLKQSISNAIDGRRSKYHRVYYVPVCYFEISEVCDEVWQKYWKGDFDFSF